MASQTRIFILLPLLLFSATGSAGEHVTVAEDGAIRPWPKLLGRASQEVNYDLVSKRGDWYIIRFPTKEHPDALGKIRTDSAWEVPGEGKIRLNASGLFVLGADLPLEKGATYELLADEGDNLRILYPLNGESIPLRIPKSRTTPAAGIDRTTEEVEASAPPKERKASAALKKKRFVRRQRMRGLKLFEGKWVTPKEMEILTEGRRLSRLREEREESARKAREKRKSDIAGKGKFDQGKKEQKAAAGPTPEQAPPRAAEIQPPPEEQRPKAQAPPPPAAAEAPPPTVAEGPTPTVAEGPPPTVAEGPTPTVAEGPPPTVAEGPPPPRAATEREKEERALQMQLLGQIARRNYIFALASIILGTALVLEVGLRLFIALRKKRGKGDSSRVPKSQTQQDFDHLYLKGRLYFREGDYDSAIEQWERALKYRPFHPDVKEQIEKAEKKIEQQARDVREIRDRYFLGRRLYREGRYDEAVDEWERVLAYDLGSINLDLLIGEVRAKLEDLKGEEKGRPAEAPSPERDEESRSKDKVQKLKSEIERRLGIRLEPPS